MFCRLVRYLHPTDKELRQILGLKKKDSKQNKRPVNGQNDNIDIFQIPKSIEIEVSTFIHVVCNNLLITYLYTILFLYKFFIF